MRNHPLFQFWKRLPEGENIHPEDREILEEPHCKHQFDFRCVPIPYTGKLKTAPVFLAYLNPGLRRKDRHIAADPVRRKKVLDRMRGDRSIPMRGLDEPFWQFSRMKSIGTVEALRNQIAFIDLAPYHSKKFHASKLINCLPSMLHARAFMRDVLVPQARRGERFLVIGRAWPKWGVHPTQSGDSLRVLNNRGGYLGSELGAEIAEWLCQRRSS